jgi:anti-sigma regulatory factor (Ser/Thr protein kinase)
MQDSSQWQRTLPNRLDALMPAIEELSRCLEQWGADANACYLAQLAVEELGTNIIKYGYDDQAEHLICLSAICEQSVFRICLEDDGHEFNPCLTPEPDPDLSLQERTPGGWGLSLVRRMLSGMKYERRGNRNVLSLMVPRVPASPVS